MQVKKAVIAVAGFGTRFLPASKAVPKELFPIINVPILEILVKELSEAGIEEILVVSRKGKEAIQRHFDRNVEVEQLLQDKQEYYELATRQTNLAKISFVLQEKPLGFADAVYYAKDFVKDDVFILCVGDEVFFSNQKSLTTQLIESYDKYNTPCIALYEVPLKETSLYGIAKGDVKGSRVELTNIVEKPKENPPSRLANIGRYVMTPKLFGIIENLRLQNEEVDFAKCLAELIHLGELTGVIAQGVRFDTGNRLGFVKANIYASLKDNSLKEDIIQFLKEMIMLNELQIL